MPTYDKPRIISCGALSPNLLTLPGGCLDEAIELLRTHGIEAIIIDHRESGQSIQPLSFVGKLHQDQQVAADSLAAHNTGVLAATTGFGKTVVAAALIARRACSTLILVHRRELMMQWIERLSTFLSLEHKEIGIIGGARRKPTGRYLGEGFDDPRLDTLFLAAPIAWKGTLTQYVGRLHREHHGKTEVIVHDYVDGLIPILARMAAKRQIGYRALGYSIR